MIKQHGSKKLSGVPAAKQKQLKKAKRASGGVDAFASADDYMQDIETDLAALPADVALSEAADEQSTKQSWRRPHLQQKKARRA